MKLHLPKVASLLLVAATACLATPAIGAPKTVCTITINSPDEKEAFRRALPPGQYDFVELVERGRRDWLASACQRKVRCDMLVVSGHFDGDNGFFSDRLDLAEYLPVDEMERVSCSDSCSGLFSQLKEVYLFGCNTLNPAPTRIAGSEIPRSLVRAGHSPADAQRLARAMQQRHGQSNRERMRRIFKDVPVIYGFSSVAPLGPTNGALLSRYFQSAGTREVASGRPSGRLLDQFSAHAMVGIPGVRDGDAEASWRAEACRFVDDRLSAAQRLAFVHELLDRDVAEVRMQLDSIERTVAAIDDADRAAPDVAQALDAIAADRAARERFIAFARDADQPSVRARMIGVAHELGWLDEQGRDDELGALLADLAAGSPSAADVDLACTLNADGSLDAQLARVAQKAAGSARPSEAAILACLGSAPDRAKVLQTLTRGSDADVEVAQVYLRHRPLEDEQAIRDVAAGIAGMTDPVAQARALEALSRHPIEGPALAQIAQLYPQARSVAVQRAIAGVLIRSDYRSLATPQFVDTLRQHRLKGSGGEDLIDVLLRRLETASAKVANNG